MKPSSLALLLLLAACHHVALAPGSEPEGVRVTLDEATALVRARIFEDRPGLNESVETRLSEHTTDELWERLGAQLFVVEGGELRCESYLVREHRVHPLCNGYGGHGVQSACVTDLDADGEPELSYTYSWGSGIHRSLVGVCGFEGDAFWNEEADVAYVGDLFVRKESDTRVLVEIGDYGWTFGEWSPVAAFGELVLTGGAPRVDLAELAPEHARAVWRP